MTSPKTKGIRFERYVKKKLEKLGAYVIRSSASSGVFDLIAIFKHTRPIGIQCKYNGILSAHEKSKIMRAVEKYDIIPAIAYKEGSKVVVRIMLNGELIEDYIKD